MANEYNPQFEKLRSLMSEPPKPQTPSAQRQTASPQQQMSKRPVLTGLPERYLSGGYFDELGYMRPELLLDHAREVARVIGQAPDGIKNAQLRKFYAHVKAAETRMNYGVPFAAVKPALLQLEPFAADARGKRKVPPVFEQFIQLNLQQIVDEKSFRQGMVKHFQAVVCYFGSLYRD